MALYNGIIRSNYLTLRIFCTQCAAKLCVQYNKKREIRVQPEVDAIDTFTTHLVQRKINKWIHIKTIRKNLNENKAIICEINVADVSLLTEEQLDDLVDKVRCTKDVEKITNIVTQCIEAKVCLSIITIQKLISFYSQNSDRETVERLQRFFEEVNPTLYNLNAKFLHYSAEVLWRRGNISESLKYFLEIYENYSSLRRKINRMLRYLISSIITNQSEASLIMIIKFAENLATNYSDFYLLAYTWQICFLSEWYADQCRTVEILERNSELWTHLAERIPSVVNSALRNHQPEAVYRLFELLLKYNMDMYYSFILRALFRYKYSQNDFRSCAEIIQWTKQVNVSLSKEQQKQCSLLLLGKVTSETISQPDYFQFKF